MVAAGAVKEPTESGTYKRIRAHLKLRGSHAHRGRRWHVRRSLRDTDCLIRRANAAAEASCRVTTNLRPGHVSVHTGHNVIGLATHIADLQHDIFRNPPFHWKGPFLECRRFHHGIHASSDEDRAVGRPATTTENCNWAGVGRQ